MQKRFVDALRTSKADAIVPEWPENLREIGQDISAEIDAMLTDYHQLAEGDDSDFYRHCLDKSETLSGRLRVLEGDLFDGLEAEHGARVDSPGFRQFMAEYQVSFPTANLDATRDVKNALTVLDDWLRLPAGRLAYERVFVLSGDAGSGKTHGVCDAADHRFSAGLLSCVVFGHQFSGNPNPWTRLSESLGLPTTLGMDDLLDKLNRVAEASGALLILCIDAINETRSLRYWREHLPAVAHAIRQKSHLRLCVTCRTPRYPCPRLMP